MQTDVYYLRKIGNSNEKECDLFTIYVQYHAIMGRGVALWLRHYATNRQVAGSISDGIIGIFQ